MHKALPLCFAIPLPTSSPFQFLLPLPTYRSVPMGGGVVLYFWRLPPSQFWLPNFSKRSPFGIILILRFLRDPFSAGQRQTLFKGAFEPIQLNLRGERVPEKRNFPKRHFSLFSKFCMRHRNFSTKQVYYSVSGELGKSN